MASSSLTEETRDFGAWGWKKEKCRNGFHTNHSVKNYYSKEERSFEATPAGAVHFTCSSHHKAGREARTSSTVSRYRKRIERKQQNHFPSPRSFVPSLAFDLHNVCKTHASKCLSLNQTCSKCLPNSRDHFIDKEYFNAGLQDLLVINRHTVRGIFHWLCPVIGWSFQVNLLHPLICPKQETLSSPRVLAAIERSAKLAMDGVEFDSPTKQNSKPKIPKDESVALKQEQSRAKGILDRMCGPVYFSLLRLAYCTLWFVFKKLFRHFYVQRSHVEMLKSAQSKNLPIVFLPCHKSHIDYILLTFALISIGIKVPHIAAGDNLSIPVFSWLIHHLGGFFIRRKLDLGNVRDVLYRECLHEYIEQLLRANQNLEMYIEGSRSRTGKPSLPKSGLLSFLVDAVRNGAVSDLLIVPVGISYDRIVERNFVRQELMGGNKKPESFLKALGGIWRMLTSDIGCVRMDFSQPFSLQEYLNTCNISQNSLLDLSVPLSSPINNSSSTNNLSTFDRHIITALGHHVVYDFTQTATVMSTNIVGFLLLTKHRHGVRIPQLIVSYMWIADKVSTNGRALGFSGSPSEAVHYALNYLSHLIVYEEESYINERGEREMYKVVCPKLELPDVFQLAHHLNQINVLFAKESLVACSLMTIQEFKRQEERDNEGSKKSVLISQTELLEYAFDFAKIFARELIFAPPCIDIDTVLYEGIESLTTANVFKVTQSISNASRDLYEEDWDNEEQDILLETTNTSLSRDHLHFLQSILAPFIEGYWNVAMELLTLWKLQQVNNEEAIKENDFLLKTQRLMIEKDKQGKLLYVECCSMDILRNALKSFVCMGLVTLNKEFHITVTDHSGLIDVIDILTACK